MKIISKKGAVRLCVAGLLLLAGKAFAIHPLNETATPDPGVPMFAPPAVISNGQIKLGVRAEGHLNIRSAGIPSRPPSSTTAVGLRLIFPDGSESEATAPGCLCEGWGASADAVSGYANVAVGGVANLVPVSFVDDPLSAVAVVDVDNGGGPVLRVTHDYHPSPDTPWLYEVTVTMTNVSGADIADLRYRRVMDWDISPTTFNEYVTNQSGSAADLVLMTTNGFDFPDPLSPPDTSGYIVGDVVDGGPTDHGAFFQFEFGALADGESKTFNIYYGAAFNEPDALAALAAVGAEAYSFGQPNVDPPADHGEPNTFIFAFSGVGGEPIFDDFDVCVSQEQTPGAGDFEFLGIIEEFDRSGESAADVYSYNNPAGASYNGTPPSISDTSQLFLVNTNDGGGASLFVVHDTPSDGTGGSAAMTFDLAGDTAAILVRDDPGDGYVDVGGTQFDTNHNWVACCTDGVVIGTLDGSWVVDAQFTSLSGMSAWQATSADGTSISLVPDLERRVRLAACNFEKELTSGPDRDQDGAIDVVVPINVETPTEYDFTITYDSANDQPVWIYDKAPAEWDVTHIEGSDFEGALPVDCGESADADGDHGMVDVWRGGKAGKNCNSDTSLRWMPSDEDDDLNVQLLARCHDNRNNKRCRPTSCGALYLNYGAIALAKGPDGELLLDADGNPIPVAGPTNSICLAAVDDVDGDGEFTWDGSGDEDGDTLPDYLEACEFGTDPCLADTDGDGVRDDVDDCPLEGPPDPELGEILDPDGCIRQSQCSDGIDNDDDGPIDFPDDASCEDILDDSEDTPDTPPDCVEANGLLWCFNNDACGEACNDVCATKGLTPVADSTAWFEAQNTEAECQVIADALGGGLVPFMNSWTYACLEDTFGDHTVGGGLNGPSLFCSTFSGCPDNHRTNMDQLGVACGPNSRRSICPCE